LEKIPGPFESVDIEIERENPGRLGRGEQRFPVLGKRFAAYDWNLARMTRERRPPAIDPKSDVRKAGTDFRKDYTVILLCHYGIQISYIQVFEWMKSQIRCHYLQGIAAGA